MSRDVLEGSAQECWCRVATSERSGGSGLLYQCAYDDEWRRNLSHTYTLTHPHTRTCPHTHTYTHTPPPTTHPCGNLGRDALTEGHAGGSEDERKRKDALANCFHTRLIRVMPRQARVRIQTHTHAVRCDVAFQTAGPRSRAARQCMSRKVLLRYVCRVQLGERVMCLDATQLRHSGVRRALETFFRSVCGNARGRVCPFLHRECRGIEYTDMPMDRRSARCASM